MAKPDVIKATLTDAEDQIEASTSVLQLVQAGVLAWQALAKFESVGDAWETLDELLRVGTERIAGATAPFQMKFHHGLYLAPTPIRGTRVRAWLVKAKPDDYYGADVVFCQEPGRIEVALIRGLSQMATPMHLICMHVSNPLHTTHQLAKWDYLPNAHHSEFDYTMALDKIARRERNILAGVSQQRANYTQSLAARKASKEAEGVTA